MTDLTFAEVMEQHPRLGRNGIGVLASGHQPRGGLEVDLAADRVALAESEATVHEIVAWLRDHDLTPIKTPSVSSYTLKHLVEKDIGYVSNGEFIAAALMVGYPHSYEGGRNVLFGVSARDVRRVSESHG